MDTHTRISRKLFLQKLFQSIFIWLGDLKKKKPGFYVYYTDMIIVRGVSFLLPAGKTVRTAQLAGKKNTFWKNK